VTPELHNLNDLRASLGTTLVEDRDGRITASPQTTEEVAVVARYANERKLAIEVLGAGTKQTWGNQVRADILLDTTKLAGVTAHSWQDLTATVAAGTPWAAMQRSLAKHNQQVALDPLWPETATVGGIIATNDSGALRLKYGSLRDLIIGMTIVLADGTIAKSGGKVVKNVAGYDLHKLMTGAFGTLGVITEVTFRLHPMPSQTRVWTVTSADAEPLGKLLMLVLDSKLSTQAMQLRAGAAGYALDVELATLPESMTIQLAVLDQFGQRLGLASVASPLNVFKAREQLFAAEGGVIIKATMLPSVIAKLCAEVVQLGGTAVAQAAGILFARFDGDEVLSGLERTVKAAGDGSITVLRALQPSVASWGTEKASPLSVEIKRQFDPNRILNPGRFLDGI
jgi:glycolate oxidase FAD binding subunit